MTGLTLELERVIRATRPVVFGAFADPAQLAKWWGPEGFSVPTPDFDPRPGAAYRIEMQPPEGEPFHITGDFRDVEPPKRLAFTFTYEPADPDDVTNLVELSFHERGGSTDVTLTHGPFKTEERRELHRRGWSDTFDKLERLVGES
jgi:uncharacterized protein YndB with AHSA1/START domain